jgi:hypothetical protein
VLLAKVVGHVAPLVERAALDERAVAEHPPHPGGERLGAVDDHEQTRFGRQPARPEVGEQGGDHGRVLRVAEPQADRHLAPVGRDHQGGDAALSGNSDAVDHEHGHLQIRQVTGHELGQRPLGRPPEAAADRRARVAPGSGLERLAQGLGDGGVAAGGPPASIRSSVTWSSRSSALKAAHVSRLISVPARVRPRGRVAPSVRRPSTTELVVLPCQLPARPGIRACFGPIRAASSASINWCLTRRPAVEAKASRPSLIEPATSARATVASADSPASREAAAGAGVLRRGIFRATVVLLAAVSG